MIKNGDKYSEYFTGELLMGPNSVYLLDELLAKYPPALDRSDSVLDLGCGKGLTSLFLARETGAAVCANDLWVSGEDNRRRFDEWGVGDRVTTCHEDATQLGFEREKFALVVSVDSYHYFAGSDGFFEEKILPFVKRGGSVLIAIPGIKDEFEGRQDELLGGWLGDEAYMFKSRGCWRELIGCSDDIASADVWEMENFAPAWSSWLATDNRFAQGDKAVFESVIEKHTCFVGIAVAKK